MVGTDPYRFLGGRLGYPDSLSLQRILEFLMPDKKVAEIAVELPTPVDELAQKFKTSEEEINSIIQALERKGIITLTSRGYFFVRSIKDLHDATQPKGDQALVRLWKDFFREVEKNGPILTFSRLVIGEEIGPMDWTVTIEEVEKLVRSISMKDPWYWKKTSKGIRIAPPILGARLYYMLLASKYDLTGSQRFTGILLSQEDEFFRPIEVGARLSLRGKIVDKKSSKGRNYATIEMEAIDEGGALLGRYRSTVEIIIN